MDKRVDRTINTLVNLLIETFESFDCDIDCPYTRLCETYCEEYNMTLCNLLEDINDCKRG